MKKSPTEEWFNRNLRQPRPGRCEDLALHRRDLGTWRFEGGEVSSFFCEKKPGDFNDSTWFNWRKIGRPGWMVSKNPKTLVNGWAKLVNHYSHARRNNCWLSHKKSLFGTRVPNSVSSPLANRGRSHMRSTAQPTTSFLIFWLVVCNIFHSSIYWEYIYTPGNCLYIYSGWWFGTWIWFFHILGIIIPTDRLIFFRGVGIPPTSFTSWDRWNWSKTLGAV